MGRHEVKETPEPLWPARIILINGEEPPETAAFPNLVDRGHLFNSVGLPLIVPCSEWFVQSFRGPSRLRKASSALPFPTSPPVTRYLFY